jgi:hypothetical protein
MQILSIRAIQALSEKFSKCSLNEISFKKRWINEIKFKKRCVSRTIRNSWSSLERKNSTIILINVVVMNIKSRKSLYAIALIIIFKLSSFHAAFTIDLKRSNQKKLKISKLHKNDLLMKSQYWKQMFKYRFSQIFKLQLRRNFSNWKKNIYLNWKNKSISNLIDINFQIQIWYWQLFKKIQNFICVKKDFQSIK